MKKQNQTMSVSPLTTNDLLTDELTQQTDVTDRTYLQMKASFESRLKDLGYSLQKGKPFSEYYSAMKQGESSGKPIQNVTQLNDVVGGKFDKSRAAYEAYTEFGSLKLPIEAVPQEFSQRLLGSIKIDIDAIWYQVQNDIETALAEKSLQFKAEKSVLMRQLSEDDQLIDTLKEQISNLKACQVEVDSLQVRAVEYQKEIEELKTANRQLEVHNAQLMEQYHELQREHDSANTERYRLEGRLEQYLSQQSLT
ncbi:hypothetical protein [Vibrio diabolicus]|uniref:hypothetical protein n=1 Tax=Vibrio diabolicus TaxID=50719 RepID=UPI002494B08C|nr:hypothetical protein [Vibrio diabolicus]